MNQEVQAPTSLLPPPAHSAHLHNCKLDPWENIPCYSPEQCVLQKYTRSGINRRWTYGNCFSPHFLVIARGYHLTPKCVHSPLLTLLHWGFFFIWLRVWLMVYLVVTVLYPGFYTSSCALCIHPNISTDPFWKLSHHPFIRQLIRN